MARLPRWVPENALVEVSTRCMQARYLLRPSTKLNSLFLGVLARAVEGTGIRVHMVAVLSNHYHLLMTVPSAGQLSRCMRFLNGNLARELGRLHRWRGRFWASRYHLSLVDGDAKTQIARLCYLLKQGCKEGLVWKPTEWPGVHGAEALIRGVPLVGTWVSWRGVWRARNRRDADCRPESYTETLELDLHPLPCWSHLPDAEWRTRVADLIGAIESETREMHKTAKTKPLGPTRIRRHNPHHRPDQAAWSPMPTIIARDRESLRSFRRALGAVVIAYREASRRLRAGDLTARFPVGTFPPNLPYLPTVADLLAGG